MPCPVTSRPQTSRRGHVDLKRSYSHYARLALEAEWSVVVAKDAMSKRTMVGFLLTAELHLGEVETVPVRSERTNVAIET